MKSYARAWLLLRHLREGFSGAEYFGLRCDLEAIPEVRPAKFPTSMQPLASRHFTGFHDELERVSGRSYIDVFVRASVCERGIDTLFVSEHEGQPTYAQWLITPANQGAVHSFDPERYPTLSEGEVLLEWAYTFVRFRRLGLMNDGMRQLLISARNDGYLSAWTYVGAENVASLRGCANVGFVLDHMRRNARRFGRPVTSVSEPSQEAREIWSSATGK